MIGKEEALSVLNNKYKGNLKKARERAKEVLAEVKQHRKENIYKNYSNGNEAKDYDDARYKDAKELSAAWNKYEYEEKNPYWLREIVNPAAKGLVSIADTPGALYNLGAMGVDALAGTNLPKAPYLADEVNIVEAPSSSIEGKGVEFAASMLGGGLAAKAAKYAPFIPKAIKKGMNWFGSTNFKDILTSGVIGAAIKALEQQGFSPGAAVAMGLGMGVAPTALRRSLGSTEKNFKLDTYDAARRQGIDIPRTAVDKSAAARWGNKLGEATVWGSDRLSQQRQRGRKTFHTAFNKALNKVSTEASPENMAMSDMHYKKASELLSEADKVAPQKLLKQLDDSIVAIDKIAASPDSKASAKGVLEGLRNGIRDNPTMTSKQKKDYNDPVLLERIAESANSNNSPLKELSIQGLIQEKKNLNDIISHLPYQDGLLKRELGKVTKALKDDIVVGGQGKEFLKHLQEGDKIYSGIAKRQELQNILGFQPGKAQVAETFNPTKVADAYKKNAHVQGSRDLANIVGGKAKLKDLEDIYKVADAMPAHESNSLAKVLKMVTLVGTSLGSGFAASGLGIGISTLGGGLAMTGITQLLGGFLSVNNGKVLDKLAKYARERTPRNAKIAENTIKNATGLSSEGFIEGMLKLVKDIGSQPEVQSRSMQAIRNRDKGPTIPEFDPDIQLDERGALNKYHYPVNKP